MQKKNNFYCEKSNAHKSPKSGDVSEEDRIKILKNKIWGIVVTAGSITAAAYEISQLTSYQQALIIKALEKFFGS